MKQFIYFLVCIFISFIHQIKAELDVTLKQAVEEISEAHVSEISADEKGISDQELSPRPFILASIPKAGTHLMVKLLVMLTDFKPFIPSMLLANVRYSESLSENEQKAHNQLFLNAYDQKLFPYEHLSRPLFELWSTSNDHLNILQIRDLRDALISAVFYSWDMVEKETGLSTVEEQLTYLLNSRFLRFHLFYQACQALYWMQAPNTFVCRFEDLIGKKGGGSDERQKEVIVKLAEHLQLDLTEERLQFIQDNLFSNETGPKYSFTFRAGQIGSWRQYFNEHHRQLFNQYWGGLQMALGYPLDD